MEELQTVDDAARVIERAVDFDADKTTKAAHLPLGDLRAGMGIEPRIVDPHDAWMCFHRTRDSQRISIVPFNAHLECAQAAQQKPGFERPERRA